MIEVRSATGTPLTAADFGAETVIMGGRTRIDPASCDVPTQLPPSQVVGRHPEGPGFGRKSDYDALREAGFLSGTEAADQIETNGSQDLITTGAGADTVRAGGAQTALMAGREMIPSEDRVGPTF